MKFQFQYTYFFLGLLIGAVYVFFNIPKPRLIIKYPTPYNTQTITYKSLSGDCYKIKKQEVKCSPDAIDQPII